MLWIGNDENIFVSYSYPRPDFKLNASLFDLHGPSSSLLYYTSLPLWTYSYLTKASILTTVPSYSRHYVGAAVTFGHIFLVDFITKYTDIFCWINEKLLQCKSFLHFFSKKYWLISDINAWNFNERITNDIVSFEQPGPSTLQYYDGSGQANSADQKQIVLNGEYFINCWLRHESVDT